MEDLGRKCDIYMESLCSLLDKGVVKMAARGY